MKYYYMVPPLIDDSVNALCNTAPASSFALAPPIAVVETTAKERAPLGSTNNPKWNPYQNIEVKLSHFKITIEHKSKWFIRFRNNEKFGTTLMTHFHLQMKTQIIIFNYGPIIVIPFVFRNKKAWVVQF